MSIDYPTGVHTCCPASSVIYLTEAETKRLQVLERRYREKARLQITTRVQYYIAQMQQMHIEGICTSFSTLSIRDQKSRWGSCSSRGTLSFNYRLIFAPSRVLDYVVVHELCHLTHMNHSKDFWSLVARVMPDYKQQKHWLRDHGQELNLPEYLRRQGIDITLDE
ncbi:MAG: M48 family metallopeptidase [Lachnospiraceae bacterium]|nr:M48 family metallopeptidase [Lachnospiraceae bacterium]